MVRKVSQIKLRAERIGRTESELFLLSETKTEAIFNHLKDAAAPCGGRFYSDAARTARWSTPGSVVRLGRALQALFAMPRRRGPSALDWPYQQGREHYGWRFWEHGGRCSQFEGDQTCCTAFLEHKNRFGSTHEIGLYTMEQAGLQGVANPSDLLLTKQHDGLSGNAVAVLLEGVRPMLYNCRHYCSTAVYGTPQRSTTVLIRAD